MDAHQVEVELTRAENDIRDELDALGPVVYSLKQQIHTPQALGHAKRILTGAIRIVSRAATAVTLHKILKP